MMKSEEKRLSSEQGERKRIIFFVGEKVCQKILSKTRRDTCSDVEVGNKKMASSSELERLLQKEKLLCNFYHASNAALALQNADQQKEMEKLISEVQNRDVRISALTAACSEEKQQKDRLVHQQNDVVASCGEKVRQLEANVVALQFQLTDVRSVLQKESSEKNLNERIIVSLNAQQHSFMRVSGKEGMDAGTNFLRESNNNNKVDQLYETIRIRDQALEGARRELDRLRILNAELQSDGARTQALLCLHREMLRAYNASTSSSLWSQQGASSNVGMISMEEAQRILQCNDQLRSQLDRFSSIETDQRKILQDLQLECEHVKHELSETTMREVALQELLRAERIECLRENAQRKQRVLEQGSVASILGAFVANGATCPNCRMSLGALFGLDILAEACGATSSTQLLTLMVHSLAHQTSQVFVEVPTFTPPHSLVDAVQSLPELPTVVYSLPVLQFAEFLRSVQFPYESQCYGLAVDYLARNRWSLATQDVTTILDAISFMWLGSLFVEKEVQRIERHRFEPTPQHVNYSSNSRRTGLGGNVDVQFVDRELLPRLAQVVRLRSFLSCTVELQSIRCASFPDSVQQEIGRIRLSYRFLPTVLCERWVAGEKPLLKDLWSLQSLSV